MEKTAPLNFIPVDISEHDVIEAMKSIHGYLDITPGDFKELYQSAYTLAIQRLLTSLTADKIMTRPVIVADLDMGLADAARLLAEKKISGCPVVDFEGKVVGIVSEKDFLKEMGFGKSPSFMQLATHCLTAKGCGIGKLHNKTVGTIMSKPPITANAKITIGAISTLFAQHKINRLPIVDNYGKLAGMVTRTNLAHTFHAMQEKRTS